MSQGMGRLAAGAATVDGADMVVSRSNAKTYVAPSINKSEFN
jgi:hypothetical protein